MLPAAVATGNQCADGIAAAGEVGARAPTNRRTRKTPSQVHVTVPVAFNNQLGCGDAAFVLAEMLRHILFMRGQLPMPYHQLRKVLDEREGLDSFAREQKAAAAAAAAAAATAARASGDTGAAKDGGEGVGRGVQGGEGPRGIAAMAASRRSRGTRAKSGRPLAKASAHRRARKCLGVLEETTLALEAAFADAAGKGRSVLEALVLLGASHLSPREVYSITFAEPSPDGTLPGKGGNGGGDGGGGGVQGKSSLAGAYARKLVRSVVGEMSSVTFRGLGSARVHLFLRVADAPLLFPAQNGNSATASSSSNSSSNNGSGTKAPNNGDNNGGADTARSPHPTPAPSCAPSPTSLAADPALDRLVPRPGFKIRVSRSRPAPKVSIVLSKRPPAPPSFSSQPPSGNGTVGAGQDGHRRQQIAEDEEELVRGGAEGEGFRQQQQQQRSVWYQLVCARLVGLKGCDSLAG